MKMTPDHERWCEALAVDQQHGDSAPAFIAERLRTLAMAGDEAGVSRWKEIARRYYQLGAGGTMQ